MSKTASDESVAVEIMGRVYQVRSKDDKQYVVELAKMVNEKMLEVERSGKIVDSLRIAVLTCLNLADESIKLKANFEKRNRELEEERKRLLDLIDQATGGT